MRRKDELKGARILVVEDEALAALDLRNRLASFGYAVSALVTTGEEALASVERDPPDLVLMDVMLRGPLDGIETARCLRTRLDAPIIYLSAYSDDSTLDRARRTEPFGYLLKPYDERELYTTIEMALYKHSIDRRVREQERWLATILRSVREAVVAVDQAERITFLNPAAAVLMGLTREEALGCKLAVALAAADPPPTDSLAGRTRISQPDGPRTLDYTVAPICGENGAATGRVLALRDVTDKVIAEEALRASEERLRDLARHEQAVREEERRRLAREIHDEIGQTLAAVRLEVSRLSAALPPAAGLAEHAHAVSALTEQCAEKIRGLLADLRPHMLDELGLSAALRWQARTFHQKTGIPCRLELAEEAIEDLATGHRVALFRVVEEALHNIWRHAGAREALVRLVSDDERIELEVRDDGRGIRPEEAESPRGFGLAGIRERIGGLGGSVAIEGRPAGTVLRVELPVELEGGPDDEAFADEEE